MSIAILVVAFLAPVQPQVSVSGGIEVEAHVPTVQFEAEPALVVVAPGVMVVPGHDREVFFAGGFYWYNVSGAWFRTRSHRGGWVRVATARVPVAIIRLPRGKYRHFRGGRLYRRAGRVPPRRAAVKVTAKKAKRKKAHAAARKTKRKAHAVKKRAAKTKKVRTARAAKPRTSTRSARRSSARRRARH
ncbi:MAG TPA: hypothetical protein VFU21_18720 [Kofleriaceae bacterium]|nr:hypothetical protein [Kofleriaceae bacterium]